ncbi:hypothetical protein JOF56_001685 [Kibdelosporangium banguiense]|uniref:CU044_5270 family protein n=1 Tax=Kibdelosporangium banguiense TaxID=1365924 RepID=A0ABS4TA50_9PSEU|nr:CU044_5270 family protein [Kibdelosporangium banguiense]MBP2321300.1 hypothetical protein [Kibdelosporangium banguiense]
MTEQENVRPMWSEEELDQALATLRAQVPPGEESLAGARAELMRAAGSPVPAEKKRHWGRWVAAIATIAAVVAGVLIVPTLQFGDEPAPSTASAAAVLNSAADKIGASDPVVKPGQYLYTESHEWHSVTIAGDKPLTYLEESVTQTWIPADRTQEWLQRSSTTGQRKWITGSDAELKALGINPDENTPEELRAKCGDFYLNPGEQPCQRQGGWERPTPEFLAGLPTDPKQLYDLLRAAAAKQSQDPDLEVLVVVSDTIRSATAPAAVRANLYRAVALSPDLKISDNNANLDGRVGVGLGFERGGLRQELIIDPVTGQFIGERQTAAQDYPSVPKGTVTGYTSVSTGVVDKVGDKPTG